MTFPLSTTVFPASGDGHNRIISRSDPPGDATSQHTESHVTEWASLLGERVADDAGVVVEDDSTVETVARAGSATEDGS